MRNCIWTYWVSIIKKKNGKNFVNLKTFLCFEFLNKNEFSHVLSQIFFNTTIFTYNSHTKPPRINAICVITTSWYNFFGNKIIKMQAHTQMTLLVITAPSIDFVCILWICCNNSHEMCVCVYSDNVSCFDYLPFIIRL